MSATGTARSVVLDLLRHGVREAVLAPGSRSGPLALALAAADDAGLLRLHVRVDEREAGFLALGLAKATRTAVPVVTTSGTAVANLHPAMLEARHAGVALIAITADRPARLRGTGANQTTDQREIFPGVRFLDDPDDLWAPIGRGVPAHLNLELDEPLLEPAGPLAPLRPAVREHPPSSRPVLPLERGPRTVVVAGDDAGRRARHLAEASGWPLLAEPTSGSRNGENALVSYRLLLAHSPLVEQVERVVSWGHATLSRPVTRLLARTDVEIVHVGDASTFPGPAGPNVRFVHDVAPPSDADDGAWLAAWREADAAATRAVDALLDGTTPLDVARTVNAAVPPGGLLFVGSSNPVRDLDLVARPYPVGEKRLVLANRGLAGIDGVVSSAVGAALGRPESRALAYLGDLTFLHGSNGLLIGPDEPRPDLTIVVANDDGGSIFATLEQGGPEYASPFERVFATPTGADLAALCAGLRVGHVRVAPQELAAVLDEPVSGVRVVEVPVSRTDRRQLARSVDEATRRALRP